MIRELKPPELSAAADVIRASFATVAKDFGITEQNCPKHTAFVTTAERLQTHYNWGWLMYGMYENERLVGYASISKEAEGAYELHNLAVLPDYRHKGYGKRLLGHCQMKVKELGGDKITLGMIEENTVLKNWYASNGFIHTRTKKIEQFPFTSGFMEWEAIK